MAPLVKLDAVSKMGKEAFFLQKLACLFLLYTVLK